ncbi:apoptotic chromatin condensation inducer in the nucleus-like [Neopsephotus bourkii]|uniref:apoptotic chromatin condensation inducer in the nucleus-like n=1 Tax=Neopsephotus bourkii TaxID=309878 RepID=UPI002AA55B4F|nr:apoptotic chromatin condensation inducer in the nucleus-like [Neopsephotus bourkii]
MADGEEVTLDGKPLHLLRVADLKAALEQRGLAKSGQKSALVKRLRGALMLENLQKHSTPHATFQPNSQMGEEMSQNSFIKEYLEKQQELLQQRLEREAREAEAEGSGKSGPVPKEQQEEEGERKVKGDPPIAPHRAPLNPRRAPLNPEEGEGEGGGTPRPPSLSPPRPPSSASSPGRKDEAEGEGGAETPIAPMEPQSEEPPVPMEPGPPPPSGGSPPPSAPPERPPDPESPARPKAFKRKISVVSAARGSSEAEGGAGSAPGGTRKRRWGSSTGAPKRPSISITTESLKSLIPEMKAEAVVELHPEEEEEEEDEEEERPMETEEEEGGGKGGGAGGGGGVASGHPPLPLPPPPLLGLPHHHHHHHLHHHHGNNPPLKICRTVTQDVPPENGRRHDNDPEGAEEEGKSRGEAPPPASAGPAPSAQATPPAEGAPPPAGTEGEVKRGDPPRQARGGVGLVLPVDDPVRAGPNRPSPPRARPSPIVHLCNLVRPFTLGQLKELLGRTGRLREDGFWIDRIKSHCYVTYCSVEEAVATRNALHGVKWPQSNPKVLVADFAEQEELDFHRGLLPDRLEGGEEPPPGSCPQGRGACPGGVSGPGRSQSQWAEREREMERRERARGEREWDRDKGPAPSGPPPPSAGPSPSSPGHAPSATGTRPLGGGHAPSAREPRPRHRQPMAEKDRTGRGSREGRGEKKEKPPEEPPAKLLDDLFRKTKAAPCIYWLPLTDTQFVQKQAERAARARERERRRKEQEEEEQRQQQQQQQRGAPPTASSRDKRAPPTGSAPSRCL